MDGGGSRSLCTTANAIGAQHLPSIQLDRNSKVFQEQHYDSKLHEIAQLRANADIQFKYRILSLYFDCYNFYISYKCIHIAMYVVTFTSI